LLISIITTDNLPSLSLKPKTMHDKNKILTNLYKAYELLPFGSSGNSYRCLDIAFSAIYIDFSQFITPYESIKTAYDSIRQPYSEIYTDFSALNTPYKSLETDYDLII
jgi:hypothetical protein